MDKNDSFADAVKSDETIFSFFQTNSTGANELYGILKQKLEKHAEEIFDLYCGLGTITQILAQNANHVTGIDIVDEAIRVSARSTQTRRKRRSNARSSEYEPTKNHLCFL